MSFFPYDLNPGASDPDHDALTTPQWRKQQNFFFFSGDQSDQEIEQAPVIVDLAEQALRPRLLAPFNTSDSTDLPLTEKPPCKCKLNDDKPCYTAFDESDILDRRDDYIAMTREELDLAILSKLACGIHLDQFTKKSKQKEQTERRASRTDYFFHGHKICRDFFKFMHSISQDRLTALIQHYKQSGVTPRIHKNAKKPPKHSYSYEDRKSVLDFIVNFTEVNGIELPGRTPKHWITKGKLLPTNCTKKSVFELYKKARQDQRLKIVGERIFYALWQKLLPFVRTMPPATDLCSTCEQGTMKLRRSSNRPDAEKNEVLQELILHQSTVAEERDYYKTLCARIKIQVQQQNLDENHISFDYAQQVHYPYSPRQQGPIYFKTPR